MTWVAAAVAGSAVVGGVVASNSASKAASAQGNAANQANAMQTGQYYQTRNDQMPYMQNGQAGNKRLAYLLGMSTDSGLPGTAPSVNRQDILNQFEQERLSANQPDQPQKEVAYTRLDGADRAAFEAEVDRRYQQSVQEAQAKQAPAAQADANYGSLLKNFTADDLNNDAVYQSGLQFGLDQGTQGINRTAAATGSQLSGATLKALTRYGNDYGSTKANESYNRFNNNKQQTFNMLSGISGTGQVANGQVGQSGMNMANNVSNNLTGVGNARGASAIASGNAWGNALSTGANAYQQNQLMNSYMGNSSSGYGSEMSRLNSQAMAGG